MEIQCKICGCKGALEGTRLCNNCWEVDRRLGLVLSSPTGLLYVLKSVLAKFPRIRMVGSAGKGAHMHFGMEFWSYEPYPNDPSSKEPTFKWLDDLFEVQ